MLGTALGLPEQAVAAPRASSTARAALPLPATAVHTEFVVEVNGKGQVTRVRSGKSSRDSTFNTLTYGNALQAFIRTADGKAVPGTYRLTYDFSPRTRRVKRGVALVRAGGVDPRALGAVDAMAAAGNRPRPSARPAPASPLPDFKSIAR